MTTNVNMEDNSSIDEALSKIGIDVLKYFPSKVLGSFANLFLIPLYTKLMLPSEYGLYNVATAVLSFFCIIFSDWIGIAGLRFFRENFNTNNIKSYFSTLLLLLTVNVSILYALSYFFYKPICKFFDIPANIFYLVLLLIIPVAIRALLFQVLRAQIKPLSYTFSTIINQFLTIAIALYFITQWNMGAIGIILGMIFSITFIDFVMLVQSKMGSSLFVKQIKFNLLNNFYSYGAPLAAASLSTWIITQNNKFILQHYKGAFYNGLSGVGFNLTFSIVLPLISIITMAAIPRIIERYEAGVNVNPIITKLTGYYFMFFMPIIFILALFPREIVVFFSNDKYAEASVLIPFLAISVFLYGLTEYTTIQYHLAKKTYIDTIIRIIPGLIGIVLNIFLIKSIGLIGVGISTLASYAIYLFLSLVIRIKNLNWIPPYNLLFQVIIASLFSLIVLILIRNTDSMGALLQSVIFIAVYAVTLKIQTKLS